MTGAGAGVRRPLSRAHRPARSRPWVRRLAGDLAEERVRRALAFGFLPAGVLFGLLAAPTAAAQSADWPAWWTGTAFVLGVAPSVVLGATAFLLPLPALRAVALVAVVSGLAVQVSIPFVVLPSSTLQGQAWFLQVCGLGLIAPAVAMAPGRAVLVQLVGAVLIVVARQATDRIDAPLQGLQDGLYVWLFTLTFLALGFGALAAGRAADAEEASALQQASTAAADAARERERARVDALVHDRVLATLLAAARHVPDSAALQRNDAQRALDGLHALLQVEGAAADSVDAQSLIWQVQAITTDLAPEAGFGYDVAVERRVPGEVAEAMLQATEEALRNSLRHSGTANRTVHVQVDEDGVCVNVLDDGLGFDRAAVPPSRLGIAESIEGRMRTLPGGSADVITRASVGTRVMLRWVEP